MPNTPFNNTRKTHVMSPAHLLRVLLPRLPLSVVLPFAIFAAAAIALHANELPLRIGADQHGKNNFSGTIGRTSFYKTLTPDEIQILAATAPDADAPAALSGKAIRLVAKPDSRNTTATAMTLRLTPSQFIEYPLALSPENAATLNHIRAAEAWIRLDTTNHGDARIFDRITPGGRNGWLLDLYPGRKLRAINEIHTTQTQTTIPVEKWTHVAVVLGKNSPATIYLNGKPLPTLTTRTAIAKRPGVEQVAVAQVGSDTTPPANTAETVWCSRPAADWFAAFPIGNGRLGAMVHGGVASELLTLNEDTLWSGEPHDYQRPGAHKVLPEIRQLLLNGDNVPAQKKIDATMIGPRNETYLPLGNLTLKIPPPKTSKQASYPHPVITNYRRELDLREGIAKSSYELDGVRYERESFASYPDNVIVYQIRADKDKKISLDVSLSTPLKHKVINHTSIHEKEKYRIVIVGNAPVNKGRNYENKKGIRFLQTIQIETTDGIVEKIPSGDSLKVRNATTVRIYFTAATTYKNPWTNPAVSDEKFSKLLDKTLALLDKASQKDYAQLRTAHVRDYGNLHNRVKLDIPATTATALPMEKRLLNYTPQTDPQLAALYYQFGRHLLISNSRPGTQPANLQGIWNRDLHPAWGSKWTLNCNVEINYWPVETAALGELHEPLVRLTQALTVDGAKTAKNLYNARGWVAHHNTDLWATATPVDAGQYGMYQVGSAWLCASIYDHFLFSGDKNFLAEIYPVLHDASLFYLDSLQPDAHGYLTTNPALSFENWYKKPDGKTGWASNGVMQDIQIVRALLRNTLTAAQILNKDTDFQAELAATLKKLPPNKISPTRGDLQEWVEDWTAAKPHNGQVAHGWALNPDWEISPVTTPALAAAFRKTLEFRRPWMAENCASWVGSMAAGNWARLGDGENVEMVLTRHVNKSVNPSLLSSFNQGLKTLQNDGNLGITAAIGETLLQSRPTYNADDLASGKNAAATGAELGATPVELHILPALLPSWQKTGKVQGLCARGGFTVDISWTPDSVETVIHSTWGKRCKVRFGNNIQEITLSQGDTKTLKWQR